MLKLLIADAGEDLSQGLIKQLKDRLDILRSTDGIQTLEMVWNLKPDILLLDLHLSKKDGLEVLRTIRTCGITIPVLVTGYLHDDRLCTELSRLQVSALFCKPCATSALVSGIFDVIDELSSEKMPDYSPEKLAHHLLLNMGFRMGFARYECVYLSLILKYHGECGGITKCLYPKVAKLCGGSTQQVEKAVRDAIKDAFGRGDPVVWQMYFPQAEPRCPSNDVFLARMSFAMQEYFVRKTAEKITITEKYA